jgi:TPR repeat protein
VAVDALRAAGYFRQGCNAGELAACGKLGTQYADGVGVPQDGLVASMNFKKACDGGEPIGCWGLCYLHSKGDGVP